MRDCNGFDMWADGYDEAVGLSSGKNEYPFAGYEEVLSKIYRAVSCRERAVVLDLGFGTGALTKKLYERGFEIWGQDFSSRMIELASAKMPDAHLFCGDFSLGLAEPLLNNSYDFIVATYSLHHLTDERKIELISALRELMKADGTILIGDVAFATRAELERCRQEAGDMWDDDEYYFVFEEFRKAFPAMRFDKVSHCAGLLTLPR